MSELLTMQDLANGHLDIKALGEAANGDENTQVITRLGETYPSVKKAIKTLFENGGLPATPFPTKAKMLTDGANLADGDLAHVYNETANNGLYVKALGAWVKAPYDPVSQSKIYTDNQANAIFRGNSASDTYYQTAFKNAGGYSVNGLQPPQNLPNWFYTDKIPVKKGDTIQVSTQLPSGYPWAIIVDTNGTKIVNAGVVTDASVIRTYDYTVAIDGFIVAQHRDGVNSGCSVIINKNKKLYASAEIEPLVISKADELKKLYFTDFESGKVNFGGVNDIAPFEARSLLTYKLKAGTKVTLVNTQKWVAGQPRYQFGFGVRADNALSPFATFYAESTYTHTITADKPYIRFFFRDERSVGTALNIAEALTHISIYVEQPVLRDSVFTDSGAVVGIGLSAIPKSSSAYRPTSLATGGVITIIDDDGRVAVATELYQYFKNLDVPFGIAVHGGEVNNPLHLSKAQLDVLYADKKYIEILSHGFKHTNLTSVATPEIAEASVRDNKEWFNRNGYDVDAFVLPNGGDNASVRAMVARYYNSCYDYGGGARVETFDTINNHLIQRTSFDSNGDTVAYHKTKIDEAVANNGWLVITTHVGHAGYWGTYAQLTEIINYAKTKGMKFKLPREGFQIFGNIAENDSGFRIQANGKIVGAT